MSTVVTTTKIGSTASPKNAKLKTTTQPASEVCGCQHLQALLNEARKLAIQHYRDLQTVIHEKPAVIAQTYANPKTTPSVPTPSLLPTYLCLQCPNISTQEGRDRHWQLKKHAFSVESRNGCLYCQECRDFIYDPALEEVRLLRGKKKRKHDEMAGSSVEDLRLAAANGMQPPCRALGLRGLFNMGQTCFMSVILQTLVHNPFVRNYYLGNGHNAADCEREHCTSCALAEMFVEFYSNEKAEGYGATGMLVASWLDDQSTLVGYQQQDAHEYFQFVLNSLHTTKGGLPSAPEETMPCACVVHRTFYGALQSSVTCTSCKNTTTTIDPVMDLSLDLRSHGKSATSKKLINGAKTSQPPQSAVDTTISLTSCLERFTSPETLTSSSYTCPRCKDGATTATKRLLIKRLPPTLTIHIKRFSHTNTKSGTSSKLETAVSFPLSFDFYPYTQRAHQQPEEHRSEQQVASNGNCIYELSSVVVHKGNLDNGHYVNFARKDGDWFLFDDHRVELVSEKRVLEAQAYLLVYVVRYLD